MPRILVNCHGGRVVNQGATFVVPNGVTINFYVADGWLLDNGPAWQILERRQSLTPVAQGVVVESITGGNNCFEYYGVPYNALQVNNGIQVQRPGRLNRPPYFETILGSGSGQQWGPAAADTVTVERPVLPSIGGGPAYARPAIALSEIARYAAAAGYTDIDWISCREHW